MKILLLTHQYPYPLHNGQNLRIYHYVSRLRSRHSFDMVCYGLPERDNQLDYLFENVCIFSKPDRDSQKADSLLARIRDSISIEKMIPPDGRVARFLEENSGHYDLIWLSGWDMITSVPSLLTRPLLADIVDDGCLEHWREFANAANLRDRIVMLKRLWMNLRFERKYFCPADNVLLVSEEDARFFRRICRRTPVTVIHNGVDEEFFTPGTCEEQENTLIFEGSMNFRPNIEGVQFFCDEILPRIIERIPDIRLFVVGKNPVPEITALSSERVKVTGYVDDIRPYLGMSQVFVCPLRKGAGIKNKILQAWAMEKAVVATRVSTGGLMAEHGHNIIISDEPQQFADSVVDLLQCSKLRKMIGRNARKTIMEHYTWRDKAKELENLFLSTRGK